MQLIFFKKQNFSSFTDICVHLGMRSWLVSSLERKNCISHQPSVQSAELFPERRWADSERVVYSEL